MELFGFNHFDLIVIAIIILSCVWGVVRGFVREIIAIITWLAAFYVALTFTQPLTDVLIRIVKTESVANLISFILLFLIILMLGSLLNFIISKLVSFSGIGILNRLMGGIFGIIRGVLISLVITFLIGNSAWQSENWFQQSRMTPYFQPAVTWAQTNIADVSRAG